VLVIGEKFMSKKKYTNEPIGKIKIVKDFLPSPKDLVLKEDTVKVTLLLSKGSVNYFKQEAKKQHSPYQAMIRTLLDKYAQHYGSAHK
jgi:predicted DNA binding CopG/RHH family protein